MCGIVVFEGCYWVPIIERFTSMEASLSMDFRSGPFL